MGRKSSMPDWVYYLVAAVLSLATIPMYRYMFMHAADGANSSPPPSGRPSGPLLGWLCDSSASLIQRRAEVDAVAFP